MDNYIQKIEFGNIAELRKEKFNPKNSENRKCIELEHINQVDGSINGYVSSKEQKSIKNVFYKGDVLFGKLRPYLKKYWLAEFDGVCSTEIWVLKPKKEVCSNSQYLFNLVQSHEFIQATNVSSGSKMPRADWKYIVNYPLSIVNSFPEQKAIAKILSTWDKAIETLTELIEKKKIYKKGLMQKLLTPKKDWKKVRLGDCLINGELGGNYANSETNKGLPLMKMGNIGRGNFKLNKIEYVIAECNYESNHLLKKGDLLFNTRNTLELVGKVALWRNELPKALYNSNLMKMVFDERVESSNRFMNYYFNSHIGLSQLRSFAIGTTSVAAIYTRDLKLFKMNLPSTETQTQIANILSSADKEISILEQQLSKLKEQKKGLMQVLLTGQKRVKLIDN